MFNVITKTHFLKRKKKRKKIKFSFVTYLVVINDLVNIFRLVKLHIFFFFFLPNLYKWNQTEINAFSICLPIFFFWCIINDLQSNFLDSTGYLVSSSKCYCLLLLAFWLLFNKKRIYAFPKYQFSHFYNSFYFKIP